MASELDLPSAPKRTDLTDLAIAVVAGLALALTILFIFAMPVAGNLAASRDFVSYWAAGQQLVRHGNPYDSNAIATIEHSAGFSHKVVLFMRNPPWALPLAYPLGFLGIRTGAILWTLLLLACLLISVRMVHQLYGSPPNRIHWLGFAFTPAIICLTMGQTSLFALVGLVLFLRLHLRRPFAAGAALWLCALKPHLFLPFAAALALWIIVSRSYKLLAGAAAALALSSTTAFLIAPHAWGDYIRMMRSPAVENEFIPCLADAMRHWLTPHASWLQYLPAALCCLWALIYYWRRRAAWDWTTHGSLLMLVSLVAAPYCWLYDQGLAIPALLQRAYITRFRILVAVLALLILALDVEICTVRIISPLYLWTAPAWLLWYLIARSTNGASAAQSPTTSS
jgi:Glycosyltransferase family 87